MQEPAAELSMGLSCPAQLELASPSVCLRGMEPFSWNLRSPPHRTSLVQLLLSLTNRCISMGKGGDLPGSENPCVGEMPSLQTLRQGFCVCFLVTGFFDPKIKMQLLDNGFGKMPHLF